MRKLLIIFNIIFGVLTTQDIEYEEIEKMNWIDGIEMCISRGMNLLEMFSYDDEKFFIKFLNENTNYYAGEYYLWMGGHKINETWYWNSNNEEITYDNFIYGENISNGDCLVAILKNDFIVWTEYDCNEKLIIFCMKPT